MADFLPKTNFDPNAPNWTGASRQPDQSAYRPSKTFESLFSGIGDVVTGVTKTAYDGIVEGIKTDWDKAVTPVRDAQGVGDVTDAATVSGARPDGSSIPQPQVESFSNKASRLTAAYQDGRIGDAYYYAQLNAMTKEFKTRYPGFRDEVDSVIQKSTGVVPANALRNAVLSKIQESTSAAQKAQQDEKKWVEDRMKYAPPSMLERFKRTGQMPSKAELSPYVFQTEKEEQEIKETRSRIELASANGTLEVGQAVRGAQGIIDVETGRIFDKAIDSIGGPESLLTRALAGGRPLAGPELEQVKGQIVLFKQQYANMLDRIFENPGESGRSLNQIIGDPTKIKQLRDQAMGRVERLEQLVTDNNFGAASRHANALKYMRDQGTRELLDKHDYFKNADIVGGLNGGKELLPLLLQRPGGEQILSQGLQSMRDVFTTKVAAGKGTVSEEIAEARKAGAGPSYFKNMVNTYARALAAKEVTPEVRANFVRSLFTDPTSLKNFKEMPKAYSILTSPEITQRMMEVRDKGDAETWEIYSNWAKTSFMQVHDSLIRDVGNASAQRFLDVQFDAKTNQFKVNVNEDGLRQTSGALRRNEAVNPLQRLAANNQGIRTYIERVQELNKAIKTVEPIMKADNYEVGQEMLGLFNSRGVNTQGPKEPGLERKLFDAIKGWLASENKTDDPGITTFGGEAVGFQSASGGNKGTGSQVSLNGSDVTNRTGADIDNLEPKTKKFLEDLAAEGIVDTINVNSGFRDPQRNARAGGARASKHIDGLAVDIDVRGMTDEQKSKILESAIAKGARGIGIYPGGNAMHLDLRGEAATWGFSPFGRYKGTTWDQQPGWAHGPLKKLFGQT